MRVAVRSLIVTLSALSLLCTARAADSYIVMKVEGKTSGFGKTTTVEKKNGNESSYETTSSLVMRLARLQTPIEIEQSGTTYEDAAGHITKMTSSVTFSKMPQEFEGIVVGDTMKVTVKSSGKPRLVEVDWSEDIPGPRETARRFKATKFAKGATITFYQFDFSNGDPFRVRATCEGDEVVELPTGKMNLHRFHMVSDAPTVPPSTRWLDDEGDSRREIVSMLGLSFDALDATKEQYVEAGGSKGAEVFTQLMIRSNIVLKSPRTLVEVAYDIQPKPPLEKVDLPQDPHQEWVDLESGLDGKRLFVVRTVTPENDGAQLVGDESLKQGYAEFLASSSLVEADDPAILAFAKKAIGDEKNAWRAAQKIEHAVFLHITKKNMGVGFASAAETLTSCEGDCSEHAVLLAAACRSVGIPARVAMGLLYVNMGDNGEFGGHAWCEVAIDGKWYGLDGTLGIGSADPTHIRMTAASLKSGAFQSEFGGIMKNLGQIDLSIVSSK